MGDGRCTKKKKHEKCNMSFTVQITLGLVLTLALCGSINGASYNRHIRQTDILKIQKLSQNNTTLTTPQATKEQLNNKEIEEINNKKETWKSVQAQKQIPKKPLVTSASEEKEYEEPHEEISTNKTLKNEKSLKRPSNGTTEDKDLTKREEIVAKLNKSRSLTFDINKYLSEDFHNKNNVYTLPTSADIEKYVDDSDASSSNETKIVRPSTSTAEYDYSYGEYADVTTPKTDYFDAKYKTVSEGVKQNLDIVDKQLKQLDDTKDGEDEIEDFEFDVEKLAEAVTNDKDNKTALNYLKYNHVLLKNGNKTNGGVRKDYVSENGTNIDFRTSYLDSVAVDEKSNDYSNQIPNTDQQSSGSEFSEMEVGDIKDKELKLAPPANKTRIKISLKTNNIDTTKRLDNALKPTASINAERVISIDPLVNDNTSENTISIIKRGSTKLELTTATSISLNNISFDNKNFSIPPTATAWTLAALKDVPTTSRSAKLKANTTTKDSDESSSDEIVTTTLEASDEEEITTPVSETDNTIVTSTENTTKSAKMDQDESAAFGSTSSEVLLATTTTTTTEFSSTTIGSGSTEDTSNDVKSVEQTSVDSVESRFTASAEMTSSTEMYTTSTMDYVESSTTNLPETNNDRLFNSSSEEQPVEESTTELSTETTTSMVEVEESTTVNNEDDTFTTVLTTATTENATETGAGSKGQPIEALIGSTTSERSNVTNPIDHPDEDDQDDIIDDIVSDYIDSHPKETKINGSTVVDPEIEIIPYEPIDGIEHSTVVPEPKHGYHPTTVPSVVEPTKNATKVNVDPMAEIPSGGKVETTTIPDNSSTEHDSTTLNSEDNSGTIAAIVISCIGAVCLIILAVLLFIMRKRQKHFNHLQRCTPVSLDAYSLDNVSVYNSVSVRRKGVHLNRASKRSYGNPAFEDPVSVTHPLNYPALAKFADNQEQIFAEFEEIPQVTARTNELPDGCETKNRYANVIPLPETRVFLNVIDSEQNSDYINANYVTGPQNARGYYIACQSPMQDTVNDFWRMIWEQQSKVVLMLTNLYENGVEKCADYLPSSEVLDCHRLFGDYQVTLKKREVKEKYIISSLQLKNMVSNSWREVTHLWYLGWPDRGVPLEANSLIAFLIEARSFLKFNVLDIHREITKPEASQETANGQVNGLASGRRMPVIVHCSPGTGRTGAVIACDIAIRDFEQTRQVDIPRTVYRIRRDRASAVQTKEQYAFIYKVINLYATKLTGNELESP